MRRRSMIAITALVAAIGAGVGGGASAQQPSASDAEAVRAANAAFYAALSARDMPAFEGVWAMLATSVFERRDGRWLLVHDHASRIPQ